MADNRELTVLSFLADYQVGQSSVGWGGNPYRAIDGNADGIHANGGCSHSSGKEADPWWYVDFGKYKTIKGVRITNRKDCCREYTYIYATPQRLKPKPDVE